MSLLIQTRPLFHWRKCYYGLWTHILAKMLDLLQLLSSQDVNWWTGVVWITCGLLWFLSAVWTLILTAPIHYRASIAETVMQCYISPNLMKKQTHLHLGFSFLAELCTVDIFWFYTAHLGNAYSMHDKFCRKSSMLVCSLMLQDRSLISSDVYSDT